MTATFDNEALIADLRTWWDEQVDGNDPFALPKPAPGTICDVLPEVDSLATVTALIVIEKHLDFEVLPAVIRAGGYHSFEDMVSDMVPKLHELVAKKHKKASRRKVSEKEVL